MLPPAEVFLPVEDCFARLKNWPRVVASQEDVEPGVGRERFPALPLPNLAIEAKAAEPPAALRRFIEEFPAAYCSAPNRPDAGKSCWSCWPD